MRRFYILLLFCMYGLIGLHAEIVTGNCGVGVTYTWNPETGVLEISGNGVMKSHSIASPFRSFASEVKTVLVNQGVTSIGRNAFKFCSSLTSINIPESVTSIGSSAFRDCSSLLSINIPESVTSIEGSAFEGCSSLTSINIPESLTSIGSSAFEGCSSLLGINIPESVTSIGSSAFYGCSSLSSINIPESVTSIEDSAFEGCSSLTSINISESVTSIGTSAFKDCDKLVDIVLPGSVTNIGDSVFIDCRSLTSINIPESVTSIGSSAFRGCSSLTSINIPESVTSMGSSAFRGCSSLSGINIPESVTSIEDSAFEGCSSLTSINISESVTSIGSSAFRDCSSLLSISISESVTSIGSSAFRDCSSLSSINIPESVTSISNYAFYGCSSLTDIVIPESVTSIGNYAFNYCSSLTSITVSDKNPIYSSLDGVFFNKDRTELMLCPCGISGIYVIPESVTSISNYAFYGCSSLTDIVIPESVTSIGSYAFWNCSSLRDFYCLNSVPPTVYSSMVNAGQCTLHVPTGCIDIYAASEWKSCGFATILDDLSSFTVGDLSYAVLEGSEQVSCRKADKGTLVWESDCSTLDGWSYWGHDIPEYGNGLWATWHVWTRGWYVNSDAQVTAPFIERWVYDGTNLEDGALSRTIKGLSAGRYILEADIIACQKTSETASETGAYLFAECGGVRKRIPTCTLDEVPQKYTIEVNVPGDTLMIGLETKNSDMNWVAIDHVKLYKNMEGCESITIPATVQHGGMTYEVTGFQSDAFADCSSLTSIEIPESVTVIGENAFGNTALKDVYCYAKTVPAADKLCGNTSGMTLHVYASVLEQYKSTLPWAQFGRIVPIDGDGTNVGEYRSADAMVIGIYDVNGCRRERLGSGINIVRMSDGTVRKILVGSHN